MATDATVQLDFMQMYPRDLVAMFFSKDTSVDDEQLKLIKLRLTSYCKQIYSMCFKDLSCLVLYHQALEDLKLELDLLVTFARLNPQIVGHILKGDNFNVSLAQQAAKLVCHELTKTK